MKEEIPELLKQLRTEIGNRYIKLPREIEFSPNDDALTMHMKPDGIKANMQDDCAAFDGWALIIKALLENVKKVILKWEEPKDHDNLHYQRFLYRVKNLKNLFSDWIVIDERLLDKLKVCDCHKYILNVPSKERSRLNPESKPLSDYTENQLEIKIVNDQEVSERLIKSILASGTTQIDRQLPVGLFINSVKNETRIFTGGKSGIDIWGIDKKTFLLFELKKCRNAKVGAISELLFYSYVIRDVQKKNFIFKDSLKVTSVNTIKDTEEIKAFILAPHFHPLVNASVFKLINSGLKNVGIQIGLIKITDRFEFVSQC